MTFLLGLTGSIGMGKSATAAMFRALGVPVHDADAAVHRLYAGPAASLIEAAFPGTVRDGRVDRPALSAAVLGRPDALRRLEALVHPLVRAEEAAFLARAKAILARPGMTVEKLEPILARQMPDADKRRRAHFLVDTSRGFPAAEAAVRDIVRALAGRPGRARPEKAPDHA